MRCQLPTALSLPVVTYLLSKTGPVLRGQISQVDFALWKATGYGIGFYCSFHRLKKKKMFIKQKPHTIWYRHFLEFCFCTAETRADVVMVEMEPALLPRSTSPYTVIWVSQPRPCQEQPALFGSLDRLPGQSALNTLPHPKSQYIKAPTAHTRVKENLLVPPCFQSS